MQLTKEGILRINYRNIQHLKLVCNFNCSYCITRTNERYHFDFSSLTITKWIWDLLELIDDKIIVRVNFDGETLIDDFAKKCVNNIANRKNVLKCELITNNSLNPNSYLPKMNIPKMSFCCSYHSEFISIQNFIENLCVIRSYGCPVFVYMVATPQIIAELEDIKARFNDQGFEFRIESLMGYYNGNLYPTYYSKEECSILKKLFFSSEEFEYSVINKTPYGKLCYAGTDEITIFMDGMVFRCYNYCLGNIEDFVRGKKSLSCVPQPCFLSSCNCPAYNILIEDIRSTYTLSNDFVDHYIL